MRDSLSVFLFLFFSFLALPSASAWCPEDWTHFPGVGCYMVSEHSTHFDEARAVCASYGATIVTINDEAEHDAVNKLMNEDIHHYWVGAEFNRSADEFRWSDGSGVLQRERVEGLVGGSGEDGAGSRVCVVYRSIMLFPGSDGGVDRSKMFDFQMHTDRCDVSFRYICEKRNLTATTAAPPTTPETTPEPSLEPSSAMGCEPRTVTVTVTETLVSSVIVKPIQGPIVLPAGFDTENETDSDGKKKAREFPSRFSPAEKSVRMVISKSLGTMAVMIVVIVVVGICLLDIPCERFFGDGDKKSSSTGWLCGCGCCERETARGGSASRSSGVVTTLTAPGQRGGGAGGGGTVGGSRYAGGENNNNNRRAEPGPSYAEGESSSSSSPALILLPSSSRGAEGNPVGASSLSKSLGGANDDDGCGGGMNETLESVVQPGTPFRGGVNLMGVSTPVGTPARRGGAGGGGPGFGPKVGAGVGPARESPKPQEVLLISKYPHATGMPTPVVQQSASPSLLDTEIRKRQLRSGMAAGGPLNGSGPGIGSNVLDAPVPIIPAGTTRVPTLTNAGDGPLQNPALNGPSVPVARYVDFPILEPTRSHAAKVVAN